MDHRRHLLVFFTVGLAWPFMWLNRRRRIKVTRHL
jgi:hypothetical protein